MTIRSSAANRRFCECCASLGSGLDHHARAFLAIVIALRYEVDVNAGFLDPARRLLDVATVKRAETLGIALRLAYTLSAGTKALLAGTRLRIRDGLLVLLLRENSGVFAGESVIRRLGGLAQTLGLEAAAETDLMHAAD